MQVIKFFNDGNYLSSFYMMNLIDFYIKQINVSDKICMIDI